MLKRRSDFLIELFQYRQRERRAPLEDFLTAALVGFIRTLPLRKQFEFAANLFIAPCERSTFLKICSKSSSCRWDTQLTLPNGKRPDMVFWLENNPTIVIENKIWSSIAIHEQSSIRDVDEDSTEEVTNTVEEISQDEITQLTTYGNWLRNARAPSLWPGSLVLLTHGTPPPEDFHTWNVGAYAAIPHTCRWSNVHTWIIQYLRNESNDGERESASVFLGSDLANFLEAKGFKMRPLNFADVDAVGMHFALRKSLETAFSETLASIRSSCADIVAPDNARAIKYEKSGSIVWGYVYLKGEGMPRSTYFAWGFRFPSVSSWWEELSNQLPDENHAFCCLASDHRSFSANQIPDGKRPLGWAVGSDGKDLIGAATLSALPAAQTLQQALTLWTIAQLQELRPAIAHISGQIT